ncbi:MAG: adenosylmethionine--8-amino-7-oxononanoate transaminase, partial [Myxococcota bacterium]
MDKSHVWHPFTQMMEWNEDVPLVIERGEGNYLIDSEGRRYLDGVSSLWVNLHGHGRPEINAAIADQLAKIAHSTMLGLANVPATELARRLIDLAPGKLNKVFYSDSGSTAVEIALKQAYQYWQQRGETGRRAFVHLSDAYHGDTLGAVSVGGIDLFHQIYEPLLTPGYMVPTPHRLAVEQPPHRRSIASTCEAALAAVDAVLSEHEGEIIAVIVEPLVQGAAGMLLQPPGYLRGVAERCRTHKVLLIADEVATGFGRTGTMFACEQEGVEPDFLCLAKGISGGYLPLAATLATDEIYEAFLGRRTDYKTFFHGHSYTGNPLACAAALASLDIFDKDQVLSKLPGMIEQLSHLLSSRIAGKPWVAEIRQKGLMVGIELSAEPDAGTPFP